MQDINRRFIEAAKNGDIEIVRDILERGLPGKKMDVNAKDSTGRSALMWAACYGYPEIAKLLIEKGADVNAKDHWDMSALMWAARNDHLEVVKLLVENGADVSAKDRNGWTALMRSTNKNRTEIAKYIGIAIKANRSVDPGRKALERLKRGGGQTNKVT